MRETAKPSYSADLIDLSRCFLPTGQKMVRVDFPSTYMVPFHSSDALLGQIPVNRCDWNMVGTARLAFEWIALEMTAHRDRYRVLALVSSRTTSALS